MSERASRPDYHISISAPTRPDVFAQLIGSLDEGDEIVWNGRDEAFTVTEITVEKSAPDGLGRFEKRLIVENQSRSNGARFRLTYEDPVETTVGPGTDGLDARCHVQRDVGVNGNANGWSQCIDVESLTQVNPVESLQDGGRRE